MDVRPSRQEPFGLERNVPVGLAILGAALGGLGIIFWVAANWDLLSRIGRFGLLQAVLMVMCAGAIFLPAARHALSLLALLAIGALFAYFGQTYQTGADPWQLFALWATLSLPLCLAIRHDAVWLPWTLVAMSAIALWLHVHTGSWSVRASDLPWDAAGLCAALLLMFLLHPYANRYCGAGAWCMRVAATLTALLLIKTAILALIASTVAPQFYLALALTASAAAALCTSRLHDIVALSAFSLALNVELVGALVKVLLDDHRGEPIVETLVIGLVAAAMLAATVKLVMVAARKHGAQAAT